MLQPCINQHSNSLQQDQLAVGAMISAFVHEAFAGCAADQLIRAKMHDSVFS